MEGEGVEEGAQRRPRGAAAMVMAAVLWRCWASGERSESCTMVR